MKNSTYKNLLEILKSKWILGLSGGVLLVSCGAQMGGYTETDGVYYDPNKDIIPESIVMQDQQENAVGESYNYDSPSIIEQNQQNQMAQKNKYKTWSGDNTTANKTSSDWGNYAGTDQNIYYNNWNTPYYGWGSGWNIGFSFGMPFGSYYSPYSWNSFYYGGYYPSYYNYYNPWYYNSYYPYYGSYYGSYYGNYPYYNNGYYSNYYYGGKYYNYKRSMPDAINRGNNNFQSTNRSGYNRSVGNNNAPINSGFRTNNTNQSYNNQNNSYNNNSSQPRFRSNPNPSYNSNGMQQNRTYQQPSRSYESPSYNSGGGFRSGGGFGGGSGGGFRSSGGGGRSGGFR